MRFYTGIGSVALFNTIFTLIKPYIPLSHTGKDQNIPCKLFKKLEEKNANIIKPPC